MLATVRRLVGLFWFLRPLVAGDLDRLLGDPGTDRVVRGETGRENVDLGEPGMDRVFL